MATDDSTVLADLDLDPNEASGLRQVTDRSLLERHGWDRAFWTVLDEVDVAACIGLLGHRGDASTLEEGWSVRRVPGRRDDAHGRADDAEAVASHDGWIYVFGSQHGGKDGPIRQREQWVARFREHEAAAAEEVDLQVVQTGFGLHRAVNDALRGCDLDIVELRPSVRAAFPEGTVARLDGEPEQGRVRADDWTINVEGAEITGDGTLLLGLRFPTTAEGRPLLIELVGLAALFEDGAMPRVTAVRALDAVGRGGTMAGVRDLCLVGDVLHAVTGNLDSTGKGSVILDDYPEGRTTVSTHFAGRLDRDATTLPMEALREFPDHPRVEGLAADDDGRFFYVSDEDEAVHLRCTPLLSGPSG